VGYGGVKQRWLVITSAPALKRAVSSVNRPLRKTSEQELKAFQRLCRQALAQTDQHRPNQKGKLIKRPTMR
jgi:hypothetical protein